MICVWVRVLSDLSRVLHFDYFFGFVFLKLNVRLLFLLLTIAWLTGLLENWQLFSICKHFAFVWKVLRTYINIGKAECIVLNYVHNCNSDCMPHILLYLLFVVPIWGTIFIKNLIRKVRSNCHLNIIIITAVTVFYICLTKYLVMNNLYQLPYGTRVFIRYQNTCHHQGYVHHYLPGGNEVHCKWIWDNPPWYVGITVPVTHIQPVIVAGRNFRHQDRVNYPEESGTDDDSSYSDSDAEN